MDAHKIYRQIVILLALWAWLIELSLVQLLVPGGVDISGTSALGGTAGAAVGATAGSALGGGVRSNIVGAVGGAVIGGIAGAAIESSATKQTGMEYVVETENGNLMTIVQGKDPLFTQGSKVLVLYGNPSRIITDPRH